MATKNTKRHKLRSRREHRGRKDQKHFSRVFRGSLSSLFLCVFASVVFLPLPLFLMRRLIQIGVARLCPITRTWLVEGLVDPVVVNGGSMAPWLRGAHRRVICPECKFSFDCGEESLPTRLLALCPNCSAKIDLEPLPVERGDRLIIDRVAYDVGRPERWDVVVLRTPDDPQSLCVKRVVGLPGETAGDSRRRCLHRRPDSPRAAWRQLLAMAIAVYDASCRPTPSDNARSAQRERRKVVGDWSPAGSFACSSDLADGRNIGYTSAGRRRTGPRLARLRARANDRRPTGQPSGWTDPRRPVLQSA